jgi:hypothetical protein
VKALVAALLVASLGVARADDQPPLSPARLAGEVAVGTLLAFGGGYAGVEFGRASVTCNGADYCGVVEVTVGGFIGLSLLPPVGISLLGSAGDETGSFGVAWVGSVIGTAGSFWAVHELDDHGLHSDLLLYSVLVGGPVIGSMIGFNLTRQYDAPGRRPTWMPVASSAHGTTSFGVVGRF